MQLTMEQVVEMAPDANSAAAGRKLMALKDWKETGHSTEAVWGLCQGSALYQVKVDFSNLGYHCSCPSRKFPCKHVLGLLMIWAASPHIVKESGTPKWVAEWIVQRKQRGEKQAERQKAETEKPIDEKAQQRRIEQREARVCEGLERLDLWIKDLVRNGLAGIETKPPDFWEEQAKRLVDAQAPALASRIARLSAIPRSSPDWPSHLLGELGRIRLLLHAWQRIADIAPPLQSDIRQMIGWTFRQEEIDSMGERIQDTWIVAGQWIDDDSRIRVQRSWLVGKESKQMASVLQFAPGAQGFSESIVPGSQQKGTLAFYPGAVRQRAKFAHREGNLIPLTSRPPGAATIDEFLDSTACSIAQQPWLSTFGAVLHDVTFVPQEGNWLVRDRNGRVLPLCGGDRWKILAVTGGHPFDLAGEWDLMRLRPLGFFGEGLYRVA